MSQIIVECPKCHAISLTRHCCCLCANEWGHDILSFQPPELCEDPMRRAEKMRYERIAKRGAMAYEGHADTKPGLRAELVKGLLERAGVTAFAEIGPGFGELLEATPEFERVAIDHVSTFLTGIHEQLPDVTCVQGFADCLPLMYTPALVADSVFQTLPYMERFLCEAARVAGVFIFSVAYRWNYPRRPQQGFDVRDPDQRLVLNKYLRELGFDIEFWRYLSLTDEDWVGMMDVGDYLYIVGRKP